MRDYDIAVIGGDGIGPEVTTEALKVMDVCADLWGFRARKTLYPYGSEHYFRTSEILPEHALDEIRGMRAIYLGAIGDPRAPVGLIEYGIIAKLRFDLDLYINLRPIKLFDERLCPLKGKTCEDIDMVIVRENTEGAYVGVHGFAHKDQANEVSSQVMVYTRAGVERAIRYAFELARRRGKRKKVTLIDKANAIRAHDLWTRVFAVVA
jgi:3-isopropylmalate dehydrogenase